MTMTLSPVSHQSAHDELHAAAADFLQITEQLDPTGQQRKISMLVPFDRSQMLAALEKMRALFKEQNRRSLAAWEKSRALAEIMMAKVQSMQRGTRRPQGHLGNSGKASAKKNAGSSGDSGGDGGGDSDGPHRTSKKQKSRTSKSRNSSLQCPPSSPTGAMQESPPKSLSPVPAPGRSQSLAVITVVAIFLFVITLVLIGERDLARIVLSSTWIPALIVYLTKSPK